MCRRNSIMGSASPRRAATQREIKVASEKKSRQNSHLKSRRNITIDIRLRINSFDNRLCRKESLNKENNEHPVFAASSSLPRRISHSIIK